MTAVGNDYQTHGRDLISLMSALGIEKPVLVGWSCGNLDAWAYLELAGVDAARALVTVDMSPKPHSENPTDWTEGTPEELSEIMTHVLTDPDATRGFWEEYLREVMWQGELTDAEAEDLLALGGACPTWVGHTLFGDAVLSDYRKIAQEASESIPTLMFVAEHWADVAVPFYNSLCPKTPTHVMGGHLMARQYPEEFNARLEEFLSTIA